MGAIAYGREQTLPSRHSAVVLAAAVAFAVCNVVWRFGEGDTLPIVMQRSLIGLLLVGPVLWHAFRTDALRAVGSDKWAMLAVLAEACSLVATAFMLRGMTGPVVALVLAITPVLLLLPTKLLAGVLSRQALPYVVLTVVLASGAAISGGLGPVSARVLGLGATWLFLRMVSIIALEHARARHTSSVLIASGMLVAAIGTAVVNAAAGTVTSWSVNGLIVAIVVAVLGTAAKMLQTYSLPHLGSVVTSTTSQVGALLTAIGGVLVFQDPLSPRAAVLSLLAAAAAVRATILASRPEEKRQAGEAGELLPRRTPPE